MVRGIGTNAARRNGPPPDPNSLRSAKRGSEWTRIPSNARDGKEAPDWPAFITEPSMEEFEFWTELWRKPQAVLWERDGTLQAVAMYVRTYISSMRKGGMVTEKTSAHRQSDALLLTTPALLAAKILIVDPEGEPGQDVPASTGQVRRSQGVRSRFTVVTPDPSDSALDENESVSGDD